MYSHHLHHYLQNYTETSVADWMTAIGTLLAVVAALFTPWVVNHLNNRPKNSKLIFVKSSVISQDPAIEEDDKNLSRIMNVGRVVVKNEGKNKAVAVEVFIEKIIFDGEERKDFIPMPLNWTHGQLSKSGPIVRDIYPNQTVYLDIFNHIYDTGFVNENLVIFAVAVGHGNDNLSQMNVGESELHVTLYQESGQVDTLKLKCNYDGKSTPSISII